MKIKSWIQVVIGGMLLLGVILFPVITWEIEKRELEENGIFTVGEIVRIYSIKSRGEFIEYKFRYGEQVYKSHQPVQSELQKGDCYVVQFSKGNANHSKMLLSEKRKCY